MKKMMADDPPELTAFRAWGDRGTKVTRVPRPSGTWVTYSWLWSEHGVKRGWLDKWIQNGRVHWHHSEMSGEPVYRWEDIEEQVLKLKADEVETSLRYGDNWQP